MQNIVEKEASEILYSLLSAERREKPDQIIVLATGEDTETENGDSINWHTHTQSLFTAIDEGNNFPQAVDDQQVVIWEMHTAQVTEDTAEAAPTRKKVNKRKTIKKKIVKKNRKLVKATKKTIEETELEDCAAQVRERFRRGCECQNIDCFGGLSPASVYKHRLNIAELTKTQHDMYLMGVTMACLGNPNITDRYRERRRLRAHYVFQGRRVCLEAFLYLENCTKYQLKRIRKHVMTHGVVPRVHGNSGRKPHNKCSLGIEFLKQYLQTQTSETNVTDTKQIIQLPCDITKKLLHQTYREFGEISEPGAKLMGYSAFRHHLQKQFPHVKFCKVQHNQNNETVLQAIEARPQETENTGEVIPLVVTPSDDNQQQTSFLIEPVPQLLPNCNLVDTQAGNHLNNVPFTYQLTNTDYVVNEQGNILTTMENPQYDPPYTFNTI